jgi:hypothetical protein
VARSPFTRPHKAGALAVGQSCRVQPRRRLGSYIVYDTTVTGSRLPAASLSNYKARRDCPSSCLAVALTQSLALGACSARRGGSRYAYHDCLDRHLTACLHLGRSAIKHIRHVRIASGMRRLVSTARSSPPPLLRLLRPNSQMASPPRLAPPR